MALTASTLPALGIVKLVLNWAPYRSEQVSIYRIEPDGTRVAVLGSPITLSGSDAIVYDTTAPLDVNLTYQAVLANPTVLIDNFGRSVSNSWGTPEFSAAAGSWANTGTNSDYNVASASATHKHTSVGVGRHTITPGSYTDVRVAGTVSIPVNPLGASIRTSATTRYTDQNNHYQFSAVHAVAGGVSLSIIKRVGGTETTIASTLTNFTVSPNRQFRLIGESVGTRHRLTLWSTSGPADSTVLEVSDSTFTAAGNAGFRSILTSGNTNTLPVTVSFDAVRVNELTTATLTSGTANIVAAPHGWIRDPLVPGNSIRLDNCNGHTFDCVNANQMVFFQGFGDEDYASKSGVFEVNNATRPVTVAQPRKDVVTDLLLASVSLADITRMRNLFRAGRNLALSLPTAYGWGIDSYGTDMFTAGDLRASRLNRRDMRKPYRLWSTEVAVTDLDDDLPDGTVGGNSIPIPGATFGDMKATGKTFGQLANTGITVLNANPYFETNATNWPATGGTFVRSTAQAHEGVASGLLTPDGVTASVEVGSELRAASPNANYRVQAWVRCAVSRVVKIGINWHTSTPTFLSDSMNPALTTVAANTWTLLTFSAVAPVGTAFAQLKLAMTGTPSAGHLLYVDEATLSSGGRTFLDFAQGSF